MNKKINILIVEDSEDDAELILYELRNEGYEPVFERVDTRKAMAEALKKQTWDIVTTDYLMPHFNGKEALKLLRSKTDIPCIVVTGKIGEESAVEMLRTGANDYIMKGNLKRLVPSIEREIREFKEKKEGRLAEQELKNSEAKFRMLFQSNKSILWLSSKKYGRYIDVNDEFLRVTGFSREEVIGKTALELGIWKSPQHRKHLIDALTTDDSAQNLEAQIHTKTGEIKTLLCNVEQLLFQGESCLLLSAIDTTESKKIEDNMRKSEIKLQGILDNMLDAFFQVDLNGKVTYANPAALSMYRYSSISEIIGIPASTFYAVKEERDELIEELRKVGVKIDWNGKGLRKDGTTFWASMNAQVIRDENGSITGTQGVARDITERKKVEAELKNNAERLAQILEATSGGTCDWNIQTGEAHFSSGYARMLGYQQEEFAKHYDQWGAIVHPDDIERVKQEHSDHFNNNKDFSIEFRMKEKSGQWHWIHSRGLLIERDSKGHPLRMIITHSDIQDRKNAEEAIQKNNIALKKALDGSIKTMVKIVEVKDPYTSGHQEKVSEIAVAIARELKKDAAFVNCISTAALIHDIGKIIIPASILSKPGKISHLEYEMIKSHPETGYDMLKNIDFPWPAADIVLQHHERINGSGYPKGLKGDDTMFEAKIIAVADVVEAMSSHRPYRPSLGKDAALRELKDNRGILYDSVIVDACVKVIEEKKVKL